MKTLVLIVEVSLMKTLRKWFKDKWVNIGKKNKDGSHPPCGTSGKKESICKMCSCK